MPSLLLVDDDQTLLEVLVELFSAEHRCDAAATADLCGISYVDRARAWTSGYTYLHRDVPVFFDSV